MGTRDPRVDAYIAQAAPFARPILTHLREVVHRGCPECTETIKWGMPHFDYHGILATMAAFKAHCAFGFWKGSLVFRTAREKEAMGQFGRITALGDLPLDGVILGYVQKAAALNASGQKVPRPLKHPKPPLRVPPDLAAALEKNARARATFAGFPPSHKREYLEWIAEAKSEATRTRRLETTLEWLSQGKPRNWKYMEKQVAAERARPARKAAGKPAEELAGKRRR